RSRGHRPPAPDATHAAAGASSVPTRSPAVHPAPRMRVFFSAPSARISASPRGHARLHTALQAEVDLIFVTFLAAPQGRHWRMISRRAAKTPVHEQEHGKFFAFRPICTVTCKCACFCDSVTLGHEYWTDRVVSRSAGRPPGPVLRPRCHLPPRRRGPFYAQVR